MRSNAYFGGLLKPIHQESLSSWLNRGSYASNSMPFLRAMDCIKRNDIEDIDAMVLRANVDSVSKALGISSQDLMRNFPLVSSWLKVPSIGRCHFCEYCLIDDFRSGRRPSSRTLWSYWWFTICPVHERLLIEATSTSASQALFSAIKNYASLDFIPQRAAPWPPVRQRLWGGRLSKALFYMALYFQRWYQASLKNNSFHIDNVEIVASSTEMELMMGDVLAIIGKKRSYPFDPPSYIAQLLGIKSWSSLRSPLFPDAGCEAFVCKDIGEHTVEIRMAMFAMLGLVLKLPRCLDVWCMLLGYKSDDLRWQWEAMHSDARRVPTYLDWLQTRGVAWNDPIKKHFAYLLDSAPN